MLAASPDRSRKKINDVRSYAVLRRSSHSRATGLLRRTISPGHGHLTASFATRAHGFKSRQLHQNALVKGSETRTPLSARGATEYPRAQLGLNSVAAIHDLSKSPNDEVTGSDPASAMNSGVYTFVS